MEIVLLTPEHFRANETELVNQFFEMGLQKLHLRKIGYTLPDYHKYFKAIDAKFHSKIVLHGGGFELYDIYKAGGIHLNGYQRSDASIIKQMERMPSSDVSTSFHSWQEIVHSPFDYGYVFISPVFDSISKTNYKAAVDLRGVVTTQKRFAEKFRTCPGIIALGGVDTPHIPILKQYNFDGAAVYGGVWKASNPAFVLQALLQVAK